jgi:large repetitive protein
VNALVNAFGCLVQAIASLFAGFADVGGGGSNGPSTVGNFQGNGNGCFAAETRVLLADGRFKTIDQIKVGDVVKTGTGRYSVATVAETYTRVSSAGRELHFKSPTPAEFDGVRTTDEHFFWVDGQGWTQASGLKPGSWLFNDKGQRVQLTSSTRIKESLPVYTLKLHGDVAFYANGILVHDLCGTWTPEGPVFTNSPGHTVYQILK